MYRSAGVLLLVLLSSAFAGAQTAAPPLTAATNPKAEETCTVSGSVFRAPENTPLKNAVIELSQEHDRDHAIIMRTSADGQFRLKNIPPGQYEMSVSRNGYVTRKYGQKKPTDPGSKVTLRPGQSLSDLVFTLQRAAVITGKVLDEDGEPMAGVAVQALEHAFREGKKKLNYTAGTQTDDLGMYRLFGLAPGRYYVCADGTGGSDEVGDKEFSGAEKTGPEKAYTKTYYPGTSDVSKAVSLQVKEGEEIPSVDVLMKETPVVRVRGRIVSSFAEEGGQNRYIVQLVSRNSRDTEFMFFAGRERVRSDKSFEIPNVPPGEYTIFAIQFGEKPHFGQVSVDVGGSDVEGLSVIIGGGFEARGTVVWDGAVEIDSDGLSAIAVPQGMEFPFFGGGYSAVDKKSQFTWKELSEGQYKVEVGGLGKNSYVKEIRSGENVADDNGIKLSRTSPEVQVTVSSHGARVSGVVLTEESLPAAGVWTVAIAEKPWLGKKAWTAKTDQNGRYEIRGLPPGSYRLYGWQEMEEGAWEDADEVKPFERKGIAVEVKDGDAKTVDLQLIAASEANAK